MDGIMKHFILVIIMGAFSMSMSLHAQAVGLYQAVVSTTPKKNEFSSINAALNKAPADNSSYTIYIKAGTYHEQVIVKRDNVHFIGAGRDNTIIAKDIGAGMNDANGKRIGTSGSRVVEIKGKDFSAQSLTIRNDFDYLSNDAKALDDPSRIHHTQAVALLLASTSDRAAFYDVSLVGFQDTFYSKGGRSYFLNSRISGTVDFIFGNGIAVFDHSDIVARYRPGSDMGESSPILGYLTAPSTNQKQPFGLVFLDSKVIREDSRVPANSYALGRPWHPTTNFSDGRYADPHAMGSTTFINTNMDDIIYGWDKMHGKDVNGKPIWFYPDTGARFREYHSTGDGASKEGFRPQLTDAQAAQFTLKNMLGDWQPEFLLKKTHQLTIEGNVSAHTMHFPANIVIQDQYGKEVTTTTDNKGAYRITVSAMLPPFVVSASEPSIDPSNNVSSTMDTSADCTNNDSPRGICMAALYTKPVSMADKSIQININPLTDKLLSDVAEAAGYLGPQQVVSNANYPLAFPASELDHAMARFYQGFDTSLKQANLPMDFDPVTYSPKWQTNLAKITQWLWTNRNYNTATGETSDSKLMDRFFHPLAIANMKGKVPVFDINKIKQQQDKIDQAEHRIFMVGDSTASIYPDLVYPRMGWGQQFQIFFEPSKVQVINGAQSGRSSRSFYNQGWFRYLSSMMRPGDYLFIQMGHNDEKCNGAAKGRGIHDVANTCTYPNDKNGLVQMPYGQPDMSFQHSLERFIRYAKDHGIHPVLLTPTTRIKDGHGKIGFPVVHTHLTKQNKAKGYAYVGDYTQTIEDTARANNVPLLDIESATIKLANKVGEAHWKDYWLAVDPSVYPYYKGRTGRLDKPDTTHFQEKGANAVAKLVSQAISQSPTLQPLASGLKHQ